MSKLDPDHSADLIIYSLLWLSLVKMSLKEEFWLPWVQILLYFFKNIFYNISKEFSYSYCFERLALSRSLSWTLCLSVFPNYAERPFCYLLLDEKWEENWEYKESKESKEGCWYSHKPYRRTKRLHCFWCNCVCKNNPPLLFFVSTPSRYYSYKSRQVGPNTKSEHLAVYVLWIQENGHADNNYGYFSQPNLPCPYEGEPSGNFTSNSETPTATSVVRIRMIPFYVASSSRSYTAQVYRNPQNFLVNIFFFCFLFPARWHWWCARLYIVHTTDVLTLQWYAICKFLRWKYIWENIGW